MTGAGGRGKKRRRNHPQRLAGTFFGRRKAKPLSRAQAELIEQKLPALRLDLDEPAGDLSALFLHKPDRIELEIGFGGGEHLVHRAKLHPEIGFIGCEPFINGMAKALTAIEAENLANIRLFDKDATLLLDWLPEKSIDRLDLLYPDPWPKKRHWKRRFVSAENLFRFHRVLRSDGEFRFASDIDTYVNWTLRHVQAHGGFFWTARNASDWRTPWKEWLSTRYEQKAIREGREPAYLIFKKPDWFTD